jgi:adenosine deaminase
MKCFDAQYNLLPKAELHCHLEGAIRTATIVDIAREYGLEPPTCIDAAVVRKVKQARAGTAQALFRATLR